MEFVSIDIETTGLNPETCQIIEFAAILCDSEDSDTPIHEFATFHRYIRHDLIQGEAYALGMPATQAYLKLARTPQLDGWCYPSHLFGEFNLWLMNHGVDGRVTVAGKNFAGFDMRFLRALSPKWDELFSHRVLDPAMMFCRAADTKPPSLQECLERAGITRIVAHTATEDAESVIMCLRAGWRE